MRPPARAAPSTPGYDNGAGPRAVVRRRWRLARVSGEGGQSAATSFARRDLRLAAWLAWITPLLTALSSLRLAERSASVAASALPSATARRTLRTSVLSSDFTARLRSRRFSLVRLRLI